MNKDLESPLGAFTVFGFTAEPEELLKRKLVDRLGIVPRTIDFGHAGRFFFYSSYGQVAETAEVIALKLGFVRTPAKTPLSVDELLTQKIAHPDGIEGQSCRGDALIASFSKTEPRFSVFKTLISTPQLYYTADQDGIFCADNLKCLLLMLDQVEFNEEIIPMHFLFRAALGSLTYYRNVNRLYPGQLLHWSKGNLSVKRIRDLRFTDTGLAFDRVDEQTMNTLYEWMKEVMGAYVADIEQSGQGLANMLSGGVDSSILQLLINAQALSGLPRSISFAPEIASFQFEIEYAKYASEVFNTQHTFVPFSPEDYPDLIIRATDILAQPVLSDPEPCKLAIAEYLSREGIKTRYFFTALAADTLFGTDLVKKINQIQQLGMFPGMGQAMKLAGKMLQPFTWKAQALFKSAHILLRTDDPDTLPALPNTISVYANLETHRRVFGDGVLRTVFDYRRELEKEYLGSNNYIEQVLMIDLLSDAYEIQTNSHLLFLAHDREQINPFMDEDFLRISFAFHPDVRYIRDGRYKYLLRDILKQHSSSTVGAKPKGSSVFTEDLYTWMRTGPLLDMVMAIDRPGFLSQAEFNRVVQNPDHFLWSLLTFDLFQKRVLKNRCSVINGAPEKLSINTGV